MPDVAGNTNQSGQHHSTELPLVHLPPAPEARRLWSMALTVTGVLLSLFLLDRLTYLLLDLWLLQSLDLQSVFWTNFRMGATLFVIAFLVFAAGIAAPAFVHGTTSKAHRYAIQAGVTVGLVAAYLLSLYYRDYLLFWGGKPWGQSDPVFGWDIGFYVFSLPAIWLTWTATLLAAVLTLASGPVTAPNTPATSPAITRTVAPSLVVTSGTASGGMS